MAENDNITAEDVIRMQREERERRSKKRQKEKSQSSFHDVEGSRLPVSRPKESGQASSNSGFPKGSVASGTVQKPPR